MNSWLGQHLGLYQVKNRFSGGMGTVYQVGHPTWGIDMAMKVIKECYARDPSCIAQFEQEAETWANIGLHPYVVTCYYTQRLEGSLCVFSEFVAGGSLLDSIRNRSLYQKEDAAVVSSILQVAAGFALGLDWAHRHQLIHQDVKPGNVMLTSAGLPKVADFGLARAMKQDGSALASGYTQAYASPEQIAGTKVSLTTDVWSWAASVLHMFMGDVLWESGKAIPAAFAIYCSHHRRMPGLPQMPQAIADLLARCFALDPTNRPESCLSLAHSLSTIHHRLFHEPIEFAEHGTLELAADSLNNRAVSLLEVGRSSEARQLLERALKRNPDHPETKHNLQLLLKLQRQHGAASGPYLLARPKSGAEHHYESERFHRLITKATNALQLGDANEARRYLQMAKDIEGVASHPKLRELVAKLG